MFFKQSAFEKLLKKAVKMPRLRVEHVADVTEDGEIRDAHYILEGGFWIIAIYDWALTKEAKGAMIKLVGDLPKYGEAVSASKDGYIQDEMANTGGRYDIWRIWNEAGGKISKTKLALELAGRWIRAFQGTDGAITLVDDDIAAMVDITAIEGAKGEGYPEEWRKKDGMVMTANERCIIGIMEIRYDQNDTKEGEMIKRIEEAGIILPESGWI